MRMSASEPMLAVENEDAAYSWATIGMHSLIGPLIASLMDISLALLLAPKTANAATSDVEKKCRPESEEKSWTSMARLVH